MKTHPFPFKSDRSITIASFLTRFCLIPLLISLWIGQSCFALSPEDERNIGKELYDKLRKQNQLIEDTRVNAYVSQIGQKILQQSTQTRYYDFHFSVVNNSAINAFATPGGYVYINKGLIDLIESESELAGVLAHEISHVTCRHIAQQYEKSKKISMATLAAILAGAVLGGAGGGDVAMVSIAAAGTLQLKYSRENEEEADRMGMQLLTATGYDGAGMLNLLKIMKSFEFYSKTIPSYFLTHPGTDERIRYIDGLLQTRYKSRGSMAIFGGLPRIQTLLLLSEKDTDAAQAKFEALLKKDPDHIDALYGLGMIRSRSGRTSDAMQLFTRALALAPDDIDILRGTGIAYFNVGNIPQAVDYLRKAYALDDHDEQTILYLARSYEETSDAKTALRLYLDLLKVKPDDPNLFYRLGMTYGMVGKQGESHYYFGLFNKKKEKHETATYHFKEALKYLPTDSELYGTIQRAIEDLKPKPNPFDDDHRRTKPKSS